VLSDRHGGERLAVGIVKQLDATPEGKFHEQRGR
jgi:hypothetical protein